MPIEDEPGPPPVYKLPVEEKMCMSVDRSSRKIRKCWIGEPPIEPCPEKVLMVVGATGAGKTTLINGMVNYILGVQWKDNFRFKLIIEEKKTQAKSQTTSITAYTLHKMEGSCITYTMTIIDTPGFGDTGGLKNDELITKQIKEFFSLKGEHCIDHLDGIGFVTQSSLARLTHTQQYIFDSILAIFGSDVAKNIFLMVTFADGQKPPVIAAVKEANIPFSHFFKFNNSALFAANESDGEEDNFDEMFWKMGTASFKKFFHEFERAECVSLLLTKDVLNERQKLETIIQGLQKQVKACMAEMEVLRQERQVLKDHESDIIANKQFTYEIKVPKYSNNST